jgi:hypothetical protein
MKAAINKIASSIKPWQVIGTFISFVVVTAYGVYKFAEANGYEKAKKEVKEISYEGKIDKALLSLDSIRKDVKGLRAGQKVITEDYSDHLLYEEKQETRFKTLENSYTTLLPAINQLGVYVKYLEDSKKASENEKKNSIIKGSTP